MQRLPFLLLTLFTACNNSKNDNDFVYHTLTDNITKATNDIIRKNENLYVAFKYQLEDPKTKEKAANLFPAATKIYEYSDSIVQYIYSTKRVIAAEEQRGNVIDKLQLHLRNLYDSLVLFQSAILNIDPDLKHQFQDLAYISNIGFDTSQQSFESFEHAFLSIKSNLAYIGFLSVLENRIRKLENDMITFWYNRTAYHGCIVERDMPLLFQDKNIVASEDSIEITAAIGKIVTKGNLEMTVMGQKITANDIGLMVHKLKASKAKGKHSLPITIDFTDINTGVRAKVSKTLYYTIR